MAETIDTKISQMMEDIEYEKRILFVLKNLGPQRFSDLHAICEMSKSSLSKYLKLHLQKHNIEKKIYNKSPHYFITGKGRENLNEDRIPSKERIIFVDEINNKLIHSSEMIEFYKKIGIEESILFQILGMISKINKRFFQMDQNRELFLALFYIFLNSVLTREYKFGKERFCNFYNVKKLRIDFYIDKIMSSKCGFFMFLRDEDVFFFHKDDILGTTTLRLIEDQLIEEIIHLNQKGYREIYDLDQMAENICAQLMDMDLIWNKIKEPFEMLIEKMIVKKALDMGISKTFLMDIVVQSEKLSKSEGGINSLANIIKGSEKYEDLNIVSISESAQINLDEVPDKIEGFCPNCGKSILKSDINNECGRCKQNFRFEDLVKSIDKANKASLEYKRKILNQEQYIICSNPECEAKVSINWDQCPICHSKIESKKEEL
ncbi:MAG: hypothetical protein BAJALOKI1v1_2200004 [Promethearchaeota archaeon]|nr:MAG: hypothetical protein BAJALOKI1v1_2200004 [Candidatus Lokiarchaeota archaeon]